MEKKVKIYSEEWSEGEFLFDVKREVMVRGLLSEDIQIRTVFFDWEGAEFPLHGDGRTFVVLFANNPRKVKEKHIVEVDESEGVLSSYDEEFERWEFDWYLLFQSRLYPISEDGTATLEGYYFKGRKTEYSVEVYLAGDELFEAGLFRCPVDNNYYDGGK